MIWSGRLGFVSGTSASASCLLSDFFRFICSGRNKRGSAMRVGAWQSPVAIAGAQKALVAVRFPLWSGSVRCLCNDSVVTQYPLAHSLVMAATNTVFFRRLIVNVLVHQFTLPLPHSIHSLPPPPSPPLLRFTFVSRRNVLRSRCALGVRVARVEFVEERIAVLAALIFERVLCVLDGAAPPCPRCRWL